MGLLTGSISIKERKILLEQIEKRDIDIIIGTHAVIQPRVKYKNLGLVITDEQHRFGVNQRQLLSGENPDVLVMTAHLSQDLSSHSLWRFRYFNY